MGAPGWLMRPIVQSVVLPTNASINHVATSETAPSSFAAVSGMIRISSPRAARRLSLENESRASQTPQVMKPTSTPIVFPRYSIVDLAQQLPSRSPPGEAAGQPSFCLSPRGRNETLILQVNQRFFDYPEFRAFVPPSGGEARWGLASSIVCWQIRVLDYHPGRA